MPPTADTRVFARRSVVPRSRVVWIVCIYSWPRIMISSTRCSPRRRAVRGFVPSPPIVSYGKKEMYESLVLRWRIWREAQPPENRFSERISPHLSGLIARNQVCGTEKDRTTYDRRGAVISQAAIVVLVP